MSISGYQVQTTRTKAALYEDVVNGIAHAMSAANLAMTHGIVNDWHVEELNKLLQEAFIKFSIVCESRPPREWISLHEYAEDYA